MRFRDWNQMRYDEAVAEGLRLEAENKALKAKLEDAVLRQREASAKAVEAARNDAQQRLGPWFSDNEYIAMTDAATAVRNGPLVAEDPQSLLVRQREECARPFDIVKKDGTRIETETSAKIRRTTLVTEEP